MEESQRQQIEYQAKLRRESRKLADKLFRAHKRRFASQMDEVADSKFPALKIDISPVEPQAAVINLQGAKEMIQAYAGGLSSLPMYNTPETTVNGVIMHEMPNNDQAFEQVYASGSGHVGLRSEIAFAQTVQDKRFSAQVVARRLSALLILSQRLYEEVPATTLPVMIRIELDGVSGWQVESIINSAYDEQKSIAVLPRYVIEQHFDKLGSERDVHKWNPHVTEGLMSEVRWQLNISA